MNIFQLIHASIVGRDHVASKLNNQDSWAVVEESNLVVAIVTDGCGDKVSSQHSEIGATVGANMTAQTIKRHSLQFLAQRGLIPLGAPAFWDEIRDDLLAQIRVVALQMGDDLVQVVLQHWLFTIVGALVYEKEAVFFSIGDGVIFVNGDEIKLGPFPNNEPPYLGLALLNPGMVRISQELLRFKLHRSLKTPDLQSFMVGVDGVEKLIEAANKLIPGKTEPVGPISQFWKEDRYYQNEFAMLRRLTLAGTDQMAIDWNKKQVDRFPGHLKDDTTLIVGRRKK